MCFFVFLCWLGAGAGTSADGAGVSVSGEGAGGESVSGEGAGGEISGVEEASGVGEGAEDFGASMEGDVTGVAVGVDPGDGEDGEMAGALDVEGELVGEAVGDWPLAPALIMQISVTVRRNLRSII